VNTLSNQSWREATVHEVHLAFLRAEVEKPPLDTLLTDRRLIEQPNLDDVAENNLRSLLLSTRRGPLLGRLPNDTKWYLVEYLTDQHLRELRVIGRCGWDDQRDKNELALVARRRPMTLESDPGTWDAPILWGHNRDGPFTILEGNKRLVAYAGTEVRPVMQIPSFIGLSARPCYWHLIDTVNGFTS
jgi:hypothetical protein